jgi:hypothetical protein
MGQAINNHIVSFICDIKANLGSRLNLLPDGRMNFADPKDYESPRWR